MVIFHIIYTKNMCFNYFRRANAALDNQCGNSTETNSELGNQYGKSRDATSDGYLEFTKYLFTSYSR